MAKTKRVTAKDVAAYAGVSPTTVSLILNGQKGFPEETSHRVLEACRALGYERSTAYASSNVDSKVLLAVAPSYSNLYYVHLMEAMERRAKELGYCLLTFDTFWEMKQENRIMQVGNSFPFAGILFVYPSENDMLLQQTVWNKPVVYIYDKNLHTSANVLGIDNVHAGEIAAEHLIDLGHERIAFLTSTLATKQVIRIRRYQGLRDAFAKRGFDPDQSVFLCSPDTENLQLKTHVEGYDLGYLLMKRMIARHENITGVVAVNDMMALGAMDAIADAHLRVPQDYSIIGYDNVSSSKLNGVSLTTVDCFAMQTGISAVDILVRQIETGSELSLMQEDSSGVTRVEYFPRLIVRRSTGPLKK